MDVIRNHKKKGGVRKDEPVKGKNKRDAKMRRYSKGNLRDGCLKSP